MWTVNSLNCESTGEWLITQKHSNKLAYNINVKQNQEYSRDLLKCQSCHRLAHIALAQKKTHKKNSL